ncbi:MAG TPA: VWA domain-containing protein [Candidatus Binataceae bacterium]|nr:VWA domain-containing protein [Candidatus Binataceae bacterium]
MKAAKTSVLRFTALAVLVASVALLTVSAALAQQGGTVAPPVVPRGQGPGTGAVLEIPTNRQQPQTAVPEPVAPLAPQVGQELEIPSRQLRTQPGYAQATVTVTNRSGVHITDLTKDDFRVYEDGQQRPVQFFRKDMNVPVSLGIIVDTSGSMEPKIPQARAAIAEFVRGLNSRDDVFLFAFSDKPFLLQPFTTNHSAVMSRLALLHAYGRTALYDVILDGLIMVARGRYDKKALLVVTDGMDTASSSSLDQVVAQARRQGVLVYSIGIGDPNVGGSGFALAFGPLLLGPGGDLERVDARTLQTLSTETGAKTFIIREVGDGELLRQATASISEELRQQYTVGFTSPDPSRGGYRSLKVDVPTHPDLMVRVRKGVTVGRSPEAMAGDPR